MRADRKPPQRQIPVGIIETYRRPTALERFGYIQKRSTQKIRAFSGKWNRLAIQRKDKML